MNMGLTNGQMTARKKIIIFSVLFVVLLIFITALFLADGSFKTTKEPASTDKNNTLSGNGANYQIASLGVKFTVPQTLVGMTYEDTNPAENSPLPTLTNLYIGRYNDLARICRGTEETKSTYPFATLLKVKGKPQAGNTAVLKQFDDFYIMQLNSSISTKVDCKNTATKVDLTNLSNNLNSAIKQALASAQKI